MGIIFGPEMLQKMFPECHFGPFFVQKSSKNGPGGPPGGLLGLTWGPFAGNRRAISDLEFHGKEEIQSGKEETRFCTIFGAIWGSIWDHFWDSFWTHFGPCTSVWIR